MEKKSNELEKQNKLLSEQLGSIKRNSSTGLSEKVKPTQQGKAAGTEKGSSAADMDQIAALEQRLAEQTKQRRLAEAEASFWKEKSDGSKIKSRDPDEVLDLKLRLKKETKSKMKTQKEINRLKKKLRKSERELSERSKKPKSVGSGLLIEGNKYVSISYYIFPDGPFIIGNSKRPSQSRLKP